MAWVNTDKNEVDPPAARVAARLSKLPRRRAALAAQPCPSRHATPQPRRPIHAS